MNTSDTPAEKLPRREMFVRTGCVLGAGLAAIATAKQSGAAHAPSSAEPFGYCLNTSTIRGQELGLPEQIDIAARAGYRGIEPWIREVDKYVESGGSLKDLRKRLEDSGLSVVSAIGFAQWSVDDDQQRAQGLQEAKRSMDLLLQIGGMRLAAPPAGATRTSVDLLHVAQRYRALLDLGEKMGIVPQVEIWGSSQTLSRLGQAVLVAVESGHQQACLLPDVYHIFRGGSDFTGLRLLSASAIQVMHVNDYPANPPREQMTDADRVYPGDGVAPLDSVFRDLRDIGFRGMLSLELFNRGYWEQDAYQVAKTGLEKTRAAVQAALSRE